MEMIGLDLHKRESQLAIKAEDGTITDRRIVTSRERFTAVLGGRPRARFLLEASTESEWVARHLDARYFAEPERFLPERWGDARPPGFAYFPFGGGPRGCIGQSYAMLEGVLVLAALARRWRLQHAPGHQVAFRPLINLRPKHGMQMILHRRGN